ncbi:hypothetical protein EJ08DRAFT_659459 [Tothia fuscella]|uniref:Uncharacterized protein n=1 Tax=Tothia fuscella TaxID=1048955 RepID=A0A9P4NUU0_9PEZI|nr:hypothetical protein EJ08DRAFT_659459 [Tothia fuscella]
MSSRRYSSNNPKGDRAPRLYGGPSSYRESLGSGKNYTTGSGYRESTGHVRGQYGNEGGYRESLGSGSGYSSPSGYRESTGNDFFSTNPRMSHPATRPDEYASVYGSGSGGGRRSSTAYGSGSTYGGGGGGSGSTYSGNSARRESSAGRPSGIYDSSGKRYRFSSSSKYDDEPLVRSSARSSARASSPTYGRGRSSSNYGGSTYGGSTYGGSTYGGSSYGGSGAYSSSRRESSVPRYSGGGGGFKFSVQDLGYDW